MSITEPSNGLPSACHSVCPQPPEVPSNPSYPKQSQPPTIMAQGRKMQIQGWQGTSTGHLGRLPGKECWCQVCPVKARTSACWGEGGLMSGKGCFEHEVPGRRECEQRHRGVRMQGGERCTRDTAQPLGELRHSDALALESLWCPPARCNEEQR